MQVIYPEAIIDVTAPGNAAFPGANLLDNNFLKPWKATTTTATISASLGGNSDLLALFGIVAASADVTISGPGGVVASESFVVTERRNRLWMAYPETVDATVSIALSGSGPVQASILRAGIGAGFRHARGIKPVPKDFTRFEPMSGGGKYAIDGPLLRGYRFAFRADFADYERFDSIYQLYGQQKGMAMLCVENTGTDAEWAIFGALSQYAPDIRSMRSGQISIEIVESVLWED